MEYRVGVSNNHKLHLLAKNKNEVSLEQSEIKKLV